MTMKRGSFRLVCDEPGCDEEVDLETDDFDEAIRVKRDYAVGWGHYGAPGRYQDFCPEHQDFDNRSIRRR